MLQLDVLSSFAICGAGALVGAAMLRPSLSHDAAGAEALRLCRGGYALVGLGLLQPVALEIPLPLWSQAAMVFGSIGGVVMIGWALAALAGERIARTAMWLTLAAAFVLVLAALPAGTRGMNVVCTLGLAAASSLTAWLGRRLLWRPRDVHERLIGMTIVLMVLSSALRASYLLTWSGPYEPHLMYVPPMMLTPFTVLYGVLPVVFATMLQNVINARLQARLHQRAMTDHLTGSLSRHALTDGASALIAQARQGDGALAVIMVDFDHFKLINDRHGHMGGDSVLRHAVQVLQGQLRGETILARYGGEEFVVLAPVSDLPVARRVAERMRQALEETDWRQLVPGLVKVTASLGVTLLASDESLEHALARADEALYRAKDGGRNQVQVGLAAA
ncbi:MAG: GGDEF domain-containing protein [Burkholderiales bacterium]|nr:GGDEF domain-containing protein [Burkholderiales bacterium]